MSETRIIDEFISALTELNTYKIEIQEADKIADVTENILSFVNQEREELQLYFTNKDYIEKLKILLTDAIIVIGYYITQAVIGFNSTRYDDILSARKGFQILYETFSPLSQELKDEFDKIINSEIIELDKCLIRCRGVY